MGRKSLLVEYNIIILKVNLTGCIIMKACGNQFVCYLKTTLEPTRMSYVDTLGTDSTIIYWEPTWVGIQSHGSMPFICEGSECTHDCANFYT